MKNIYSKSEDVMLLAQELKKSLGDFISFNKFGLDNPILTGVYCKNGNISPYYRKEDVRFYIKFCKNEFLRIQISEECNKNENIISAMETLVNVLSLINVDDTTIGFPLAIYEIDDCLTCEYAFQNIEETIKALQNGTMFDDGHIINLKFLKTCDNCDYGSYGLDCNTGIETLYCRKYCPEFETKEEESCEGHDYIDGLKPNIKILTKNFNK